MSPLSGLIFETVYTIGHAGKFYTCQEKIRESQGISETFGCGNHVNVIIHTLPSYVGYTSHSRAKLGLTTRASGVQENHR